MRAAAMLVVAAVGCSTPVGGQPNALPITTVGAESPGDPSARPEELTSVIVQEPYTQAIPTRMSWAGAVVTSSYSDADGSVYSTGTFTGVINVAGRRLASKGAEDIFVAKWASDGSLVWVRSAGSEAKETSPQISGTDPGRVHVIGLTEGQMDCGSGPLPLWSTETFFVCTFDTKDGGWLGAGTFPTGSP